MAFLEAGGAVDGDAGTDEVEGAEAFDAFEEDAQRLPEFKAPPVRPFKENLLFPAAGLFSPGRSVVGGEDYFAALPPPRSASEMMLTDPRSPYGANA
jgi:hypothetical protein